MYFRIAAMTTYIVYCILMEKLLGATVGKLVLGLRVVGEDATEPDWRSIALRNVTKAFEITWLFLPLLLLFPLYTRYRQRMGDMAARTAVVQKDRLRLPSAGPPQSNDNRP